MAVVKVKKCTINLTQTVTVYIPDVCLQVFSCILALQASMSEPHTSVLNGDDEHIISSLLLLSYVAAYV